LDVFTTPEYPPSFYEAEHKDEKQSRKGFAIPKVMLQLLVVQFLLLVLPVLHVGIYHTGGGFSILWCL
jgi:hypothetical protein